MAGCDHYEIAIEQRLHGALDRDGSARLEAHLSTCERCRAFEATARGTEAVMRGAADEVLERIDWEVVERLLAGMRRRAWLVAGMLGVLALTALAELVAWFGGHRGARAAPAAVFPVLVAVGVMLLRRWREARRLADAGRSVELVALLRSDLDRRHGVLQVLSWLLPAYVAAIGLIAAFADGPLKGWLLGGLAGLALGAWVFVRRVKLPMVRRERAALDGAVGAKGA